MWCVCVALALGVRLETRDICTWGMGMEMWRSEPGREAVCVHDTDCDTDAAAAAAAAALSH